LVQGADAPKSLLEALKKAKQSNIDTLIIGRGGGASEDLSAFNDETLVREAAQFPVPIISAVGHEIDFTLIDYVADARASTPTGAAELATIDKREIYELLNNKEIELDEFITDIISNYSHKIEILRKNSFFENPKVMYEKTLLEVDNTSKRLDSFMNHLLQMKYEQVSSFKKQLKSLSIDNTLQRGFSIIENEQGKIISDINDVEVNQLVKTRIHGGILTSKVIQKEAK
jgi:exodeoxyribonuclease VII large subunit